MDNETVKRVPINVVDAGNIELAVGTDIEIYVPAPNDNDDDNPKPQILTKWKIVQIRGDSDGPGELTLKVVQIK